MIEEALVEEEAVESPVAEEAEVEQQPDNDSETGTEEVNGAEADGEAEQEGEATEPHKANNKPPQWAMNRINQLTKEKHEERRKREELEARLGNNSGAEQPSHNYGQEDVYKAAGQILKQQKFDEACNNTYNTGKEEFGDDFDAALGNFALFGGIPDYVADIANQIPGGHKAMFAMGQDPDRIQHILTLPPVQMALEMQKLVGETPKASSAAQRPVSGAPAPIKPLAGGSAEVKKDPSKMSMADYVAWRDSQSKRK